MEIRHCVQVFKKIQEIDPEMPLGMAFALFVIASKEPEGLSLTDLAKEANIGLASASRYVSALGKQDRRRQKGLELVDAREDPMERRKKVVTLTPKGRVLIKKLLEVS